VLDRIILAFIRRNRVHMQTDWIVHNRRNIHLKRETTHSHTYVLIHTHTHTHTQIHTHTHSQIHTYTHANTHTHTQTHFLNTSFFSSCEGLKCYVLFSEVREVNSLNLLAVFLAGQERDSNYVIASHLIYFSKFNLFDMQLNITYTFEIRPSRNL
jgi:hypothetical protein